MLLSVKPKYAALIATGSKRVEFRRTWAAEEVGMIAVYASAPVQRIIAFVEVLEVIKGSPTALWNCCVDNGGALSRRELYDYFEGKARGNGILLGAVRRFESPVNPKSFFKGFVAPQSYRYLSSRDWERLEQRMQLQGVKA